MVKIRCPRCSKGYTVNYERSVDKYSCCECNISFTIEDIDSDAIEDVVGKPFNLRIEEESYRDVDDFTVYSDFIWLGIRRV